MEDDGRGKAVREAKAAPPRSQFEIYRDYLTETEKGEFLKIGASDFAYFCRKFCCKYDPYWSRKMLADAVMFFKLHNTWQVFICPSCVCLRWFQDDDSLVLHLMYEHCNAWPFLGHNRTVDQWCAKALRSTVWKPIDVSTVLNSLPAIYSCLDTDHLDSFQWPLSEDVSRSKLLGELQIGFKVLLNSREGDSLTSSGCLRALIAMASEHILTQLEQTNSLPLTFRALLFCSPLAFHFMDEDSLGHFVGLLEGIYNSTQNRKLEGSIDDDVNWSKSKWTDAVSLSADCDYFILDGAKLDVKDMGSWLISAPVFPNISKLSTKASEILQLMEKAMSISECLRTVHAQSDLKLLTSLKILNKGRWPKPLIDTLSPELASNSESNTANVEGMLAPSYSSREPAKRQRTEFDTGHYIKLFNSIWTLRILELQVLRLCASDLCYYILPFLRSFLRMKLDQLPYPAPESVKKEDAEEGNMMERSPEKHPEHLHSKVKGEPAAEDDNDVMTPGLSSYKRSEELSTATPELRSSGSSEIGVTNLDPMIIDSGEAVGGEPPGASAGGIDASASQVASADAALSRSRTGIAAVIAESEAKPEAIPKSDAEPESQQSQEIQGPPSSDFDMCSDSDSLSESEGEEKDSGSEIKEFTEMREFSYKKDFSIVVQLMREKCAWENKDNDLFVCMTINDVMKRCLETFGLQIAENIRGWKTNSSRKYWRCFECNKWYPDQESHMLHLEFDHGLGISWDHEWFVASQVQQESQSGVSEGVEERTHSLDDSITVDCTYSRFIVEMKKFGSLYQKEEEGEVQNAYQFWQIIRQIQQQVHCLVDMFDPKSELRSTYEIGDVDAEILRKYAELKISKQNLSNLCVSDYKNAILPSIHLFMQKRNLDSEFNLWAHQRLNELLGDVGYPYLHPPDSFSMKPASSGKVIINIKENNAGITFASVGIRLEFAGNVSFKESKKIKGIFTFSGISDLDGFFVGYHSAVILDTEENISMLSEMSGFEYLLRMELTMNLRDKLRQFQAECRGKLQG